MEVRLIFYFFLNDKEMKLTKCLQKNKCYDIIILHEREVRNMNNNNKLVKELVCNFDNNIYIVKFAPKYGFDNIGYAFLINKFDISKETKDKLEQYLEKFDIEGLNSLYDNCSRNDQDGKLVNEFILRYMDFFVNVDMELFCTGEERDAFIKAAILPVFVNQPSRTLDTIKKASYSKMVEDIINEKNARKRRKR